MRDYVQQQAEFRQAGGRLTGFSRLIRNWRTRRALKHVQHVDDAALEKLGISREVLAQLVSRPLELDLDWEAERAQLLGNAEKSSAHSVNRTG